MVRGGEWKGGCYGQSRNSLIDSDMSVNGEKVEKGGKGEKQAIMRESV